MLIIGVLVSMFTAITLSRQMLRWIVRQPWARKASYFGVGEDEFTIAAAARPFARGRRQCLTSIGKRRWFYLFSALIMIPGIIFIALTSADRR